MKHSIIAIEAGDLAMEDEEAAEEDPLAALRAAAEDAVQAPGTPDAGASCYLAIERVARGRVLRVLAGLTSPGAWRLNM